MECALCLSSHNIAFVAIVPCGHIFHKICLRLWINEGDNRCPICRGEIGSTMQVYCGGNVSLIYNSIKY